MTTRIVLTGFMGSGKTTVGQHLAAHLGWAFADLDQEIERRQGCTVAAIFAQSGEARFRAQELTALADLLRREQLVIALGGGAITVPALRDLLHETRGTAVVHLHAAFPVLFDRCQAQEADPAAEIRPLLGDRASAQARFDQRLPLYAAVAHHTAVADPGSPQIVAENIVAALFPATEQ